MSDGIFSTVMTVLVLSLRVPVIASGLTPRSVLPVFHGLGGLAPIIVGYVLRFFLLAILWICNHNVFHYVNRVDRPLLWWNTLFLLTIGFIPFSTALIGRYPLVLLPVVIYGVNVIATSLCMMGLLSYLTRNELLIPEHDEKIMNRIRARWSTGPVT